MFSSVSASTSSDELVDNLIDLANAEKFEVIGKVIIGLANGIWPFFTMYCLKREQIIIEAVIV